MSGNHIMLFLMFIGSFLKLREIPSDYKKSVLMLLQTIGMRHAVSGVRNLRSGIWVLNINYFNYFCRNFKTAILFYRIWKRLKKKNGWHIWPLPPSWLPWLQHYQLLKGVVSVPWACWTRHWPAINGHFSEQKHKKLYLRSAKGKPWDSGSIAWEAERQWRTDKEMRWHDCSLCLKG